MTKLIGIRREDKNIWERRVPLIPEHIKLLKDEFGIDTVIQPFERRAISAEEFIQAGAQFNEDINDAPVIIAVKEIPINLLKENKTYIFFSHTIKGQSYNMPLLQKLIDLKSTLIDYETIKDEKGRRLVFFGKYAGLAGMIDALHGYGLRLKELGFENPLLKIKSAYEYKDVDDAIEHIKEIAEEIKSNGMPGDKAPYVFGFAGYGNVSIGAQEIFDLLQHEVVSPEELAALNSKRTDIFYKVVFKEEHLVETVDPNNKFELYDYFNNPEKYKSKFHTYIPYLSLIVNAIYWNENYPRFMTKEYFKSVEKIKLDVICDITCDINGAVEFTVKSTDSDNPAYVYNPLDDSITDGYSGDGIVNIAVDNLPTELPKDSSVEFSNGLYKFIPGIVNADLSDSFENVDYPPEIKRAVILYKGELTPDYKYLEEFLN